MEPHGYLTAPRINECAPIIEISVHFNDTDGHHRVILEHNGASGTSSGSFLVTKGDARVDYDFDRQLCHYYGHDGQMTASFQVKCTDECVMVDALISGKSGHFHLGQPSNSDQPTKRSIPTSKGFILHPIYKLETHSEARYHENVELEFPFVYNGLSPFNSNLASSLGEPDKKYLELAIFVDSSLYNMLSKQMGLSDSEIVDLMRAYFNQIQAIYAQPSLNHSLEIVLKRLDIQTQIGFDRHNGDRDLLLRQFCEYQDKFNPKSDLDPNHWDMALFISSLDYFDNRAAENQHLSLGISPIGGVCFPKSNCVIAEFGSTNGIGGPYPSAGLLAAWVAAHEMAHK